MQIGQRRPDQQRRARLRLDRGAVAIEQRLGRLPGVVPLPALKTDRREPLQRRTERSVPRIGPRVEGESAIEVAGRFGRGADGEVALGRVGDRGAAGGELIERLRGGLPVPGGEVEPAP